MPIRFACSSCQSPLSVDESKAGLAAACPKCGARLQVPGVQAKLPPAPAAPRMSDAPDHGAGGQFGEPHRGSLILVLGIVSLSLAVLSLFCGLLVGPLVFVGLIGLVPGILAWIFGQQDLAKMRAGVMDPSGEGATNGGKICGMIGTILQSAVTVCCTIAFVGLLVAPGLMGKNANMTFQTVGQSLTTSGGK